jgi:hypothetical protein
MLISKAFFRNQEKIPIYNLDLAVGWWVMVMISSRCQKQDDFLRKAVLAGEINSE